MPQENSISSSSSVIFTSNRALGYVTNSVPLVTRFINKKGQNIIITSVGRSFHTYSAKHFFLISVSEQLEDNITCLSGDTHHTFTASGNVINAWRWGTTVVHTYKGHNECIHLLLPFGPHLISVDIDSRLIVWDVKTEEIYLDLAFINKEFRITAISHPSTYINKVLLGSEQGSMQLWNIKTSALVFTFKGWGKTITVLEQAPAIDVMAVGLIDGLIILHNLKYDETVMTFKQDWGCVQTISFRTDGAAVMATGSKTGHIAIWDLEKKLISSQLMSAHNASVTGMKFLPSEPLLVTSSPDNSLKMWIFDTTDYNGRLLRIREGHECPLTCVRFHGENGHNILSSGKDCSLRIFNTKTESFNKSLGRASYKRKASKKSGKLNDTHMMPSIKEFVSETARDKEWDSIAAIHENSAITSTWSYDKIRMGELKLIPEMFKNRSNVFYGIKPVATCLTITNCGNFVIIGYNTGHVERFNMQSGILRCSYGKPAAHDYGVRGVTVDSLNQFVASGGADCTVKFWYFKSTGQKPISQLSLDEPVNFFRAHRESSVICITLEDFTILLLDLDTRQIVRKFSGHTGLITDATFSPDARWLISSSMDHSICTWDIPTGQLVDCFKVKEACISLDFSPTGEYLTTAHVGLLGVFLWSNRMLFQHVSLRPVSFQGDGPLLELPGSHATAGSLIVEDGDVNIEKFESPEQICEDMITLSGLANSRWQNLLDIDIIKKKNKPKEPPKAPKAAPFFLPTLQTMNLQFDLSAVTDLEKGVKTVKLSNFTENYTIFGKVLNECGQTEDYLPAIDKLKTMGPSAVDLEVNSLSIEGGGSVSLMLAFLKMLLFMLNSHKDFELAQAYLGLFLKVHGETIAKMHQFQDVLIKLQAAQESGWSRLQGKLFHCLSIVETLKSK